MGAMTLSELCDAIELARPGLIKRRPENLDDVVSCIEIDSRKVEASSLFGCIVGSVVDGHDYGLSALESGATALVAQRDVGDPYRTMLVTNSRLATGVIASVLAENPSHTTSVVGVTGTNGKTTIVTIIESIVTQLGKQAKSMGTLTGALTTSTAPEFQGRLRQYADDGVQVVASEISSHALDQDRVAGTRFAVAIFSNLTQDHLDYHSDMEDYFAAKSKLFEPELSQQAVVDTSCEYGQRLAAQQHIPTVGIDTSAVVATAELRFAETVFEWSGRRVALPLAGGFNVSNALLAAEACVLLGYEPDNVAWALERVGQVPGRFEQVALGQPFKVIVDYSHTPASIAAAIESAKQLAGTGRVLIVFGAAGDRDNAKRPLMGAAASKADVLFVTSDNPRTEDPAQILEQVMAGVDHAHVSGVVDRREAIRLAVSEAVEGDIVLVAGKGHEDYQIVGTTRHDFDDRKVVAETLRGLGWKDDR